MRLASSRLLSSLIARSSSPTAATLTRVASRSLHTTGSSNVILVQAASPRHGTTARRTVMSSSAMAAASNAIAARGAASSSFSSTAVAAATRCPRGGGPLRPAAVFKLRSLGSPHYNGHSSRSRRSIITAKPRAVATDASSSSSSSDAAAPAPSVKVECGASLLSSELTWPSRDQTCGDLREGDVGRNVTLCGWVDKQRDMGGIVFADIRDHTGFVQVVSDADTPEAATAALAAMRAEWVVCVEGRVKTRTAPNDKIRTGRVEIAADKVTILNTVAKSLPFSISGAPSDGDDDESLREEVRLKHRVLDLRRPQMVRNLRLRAKTIRALRAVLEDQYDFLETPYPEVETPVLTRSTPEGARDYLVPSRLQPGACYALPQSPQLFKQMLMVAGADRYYQVARCFRDEDLRADRQPEFTQLDIEMSFTDMDGILSLGEDLMCAAFKQGADVELPRPFRRMTYAEAMSKYGSDKPDLRYGLEMATLGDVVQGTDFKLFAGAVEAGGVVKAIAVPDGKRISNSRLKPKGDVFNEAVAGGAGGLAFARVGDDGATLEGAKALCEGLAPMAAEVIAACGAAAGDLILFGAGDEPTVNKALDRVRQYVAATLDMIPERKHAVLWITEFPMFEYNADEDRLEALHHPFTAPNQSDVANASYRPRPLRVGLSKEEAEEKFGYLMDAFQFGAPPHGGMAFGLDRLVMMLCGSDAKSIRDVIAFPKTATAQCLLTSAPGDVSVEQLKDLHIAKLPKAAAAPAAEDA